MSTITKFLSLVAFATICVFSQVSTETDKLVCYYKNMDINGTAFTTDDVDVNLCTHLIFWYVEIIKKGSKSLLNQRMDQNEFEKFVQLKQRNSNLKTLVSVCERGDGSMKFSDMAASPSNRANFIESITNFMNKYGFDGLDLDWEYPAQGGGKPEDKANFASLVREARQKFDGLSGKRFLLTATVAHTVYDDDKSYDVHILAKNVDWINLMSYGFHSSDDGRTGQNAPLFESSNDVVFGEKQNNVVASVQSWISGGASPDKLVLGVGTFGRSYTLQNTSNHGLGAPTVSPGKAGPYTAAPGYLAYNEICEMLSTKTWTTVWDNEQKVPYSYKDDQWVGYDNERSVKLKVLYAKSLKLGGVMAFLLATDDFRGTCGRKYPLINTIKQALARSTVPVATRVSDTSIEYTFG